ncbi:RagB/SusD family nutrient uptake outer membrane protein [Zobellia uliginosa]|uniref:RagB/SusD family nutrient uptake outer membrane protein n=1 Tax=Zobellia uliginosa TaxID=143224 RepID=UPI0026E3BB07|nr:RagB/SusD family nutrient uptake outer membrane protein [Zobellia uliginosa]MDO6516524.1 RagB/SusD family nutrient uptake outer membrane protein [Zobellia uliginosa]
MKNLAILFILTITVTILVSGCTDDFLDKPAFGSLSEEVLSDEKGIQSLLIGAYGALDGDVGVGASWYAAPSNWHFGDAAGGDAHKGSEPSDQSLLNSIINYNSTSDNEYFNTKWRALYEGVSRSNAVLSLLNTVEGLSDTDRNNYEGQARFLRGHYYFELKKMFNMVPWIDENTEDTNVPNDTDIWPNIEADFLFAYENLPATQPEVAFANKWAGGSYLAKTLLYQKRYQEANVIFSEVINSGVTSNGLSYDLVDNFHDNFNAETENNSESIFAIQMVANDGTNNIGNANPGRRLNYPFPNSPLRCCGFYQPTQDLVNSFRTDESSGLPYFDGYNDSPVKSDQGLLSSEPFTPDDQSVDPRLDWTVGRRGLPYHDWGLHPGKFWIRAQDYGGAYSPKKHIYWQYHAAEFSDQSSWSPGSAINVIIIRFADLLLMAAETEAEVGNLDRALQYVNRVRGRMVNHPQNWLKTYADSSDPLAGFSTEFAANYNISVYPGGYFTTKDQAMEVIRYERRIELAMEGHRFFDLVRWGVAQETLNNYVNYEGSITKDITGASFNENDRYYPIPQRQIDLSTTSEGPVLKQNPGY